MSNLDNDDIIKIFQLTKDFLETPLETFGKRLDEIHMLLMKYTDELFEKANKVEPRLTTVENRQVGTISCNAIRANCRKELLELFEEKFKTHPDLVWIRSNRTFQRAVLIIVSGSALVTIGGWIFYLMKIH